jgi:microcystin-dependent protein
MASTYTPNLSLEIPAHGDYAATGWDNPMDNSLNQLDTAYGGFLNLAVSGGSVDLSVAQASNPIIYLNGTLSSDQYIYFPPIAGRRVIIPAVNLNGFTIYVYGNNGADQNGIYFWTGFGIPYPIIVTPNRVYWDYGPVGPGTIAEMPTGFIHNGWLPLDGRWVSQQQHDLLYDIVGGTWGISGPYFAVGDYRGTVTAMADQIGTVPGAGPYAQNTGNRGILNSWGLVTFAGEANHQLAVAEMPGHNHPGSGDAGHAHGVYDPGHAHGGVMVPTGAGYYSLGVYPPEITPGGSAAAGTGIAIETGYANVVVAAQGSWVAHNNIQPTTTTMKMIRW